MIRVLVITEHGLLRAGMQSLALDPGIEETLAATAFEEALAVLERTSVDVAVVDLRLPSGVGVEVCEALIQADASLRVIALSECAREGAAVTALEAGARGVVLEESDPELLRQAVRWVVAGYEFVDPAMTADLVALATNGSGATAHRLTRRQRSIAELLCDEALSTRAIAARLGLCESTVKSHIRKLYQRLGVHSRDEAVAALEKLRKEGGGI